MKQQAVKEPAASTWGTVPVGASKIPVRWFVLWIGIAGWLTVTLINTGGPTAITAFAFNFSVIVGLILLTSLTRSVPLRTLALMFFCGAVMMGLTVLVERALPPEQFNPARSFGVPVLEELIILAPLVVYLIRTRRFTFWTFGITDCMLMGASLGAGFACVHDAFRHMNEGWHHQMQWLPTADVIAWIYLASGHAVWSAIAGAGIGAFLMFIHKRQLGLIFLILGIGLAIFDHLGACNFNNAVQPVSLFFTHATFKGFATPYIFIATIIGAFLMDSWVKLRWFPKAAEFKLPKRGDTTSGLTGLWDFVLDRRRLAYANYKRMHLKTNANVNMVVAVISQSLINQHSPAKMSKMFETMTRQKGETTRFADEDDDAPDVPLVAQVDLPEQYQLISRMSVGGMGAIYKGRHRKTNALVAIKILHPHVADRDNNKQRFDREAKAASALKHPNLVVVHDYGVTEKQIPYLVMELIDGTTLQNEFGKHGGLTPNRFFYIFDQVASALVHAHSRGVIHRDIKPSNILLMNSAEMQDFVKVVDFGIAKVVDPRGLDALELTQTGDILGSPLYMSPEQCLGEALDERTDIYSLGCVMYQAITGKPPIVGENVVKTIFKHINVTPDRLAVARPGINIPASVEQVIFTALEKKPSQRYNSMEDLRNALNGARRTMAM